MPTYEYRCKDCGHTFDAVQAFSDDALTTCPECGGALKKLFGNVGITFKGSGFYKTDSRSAGSFGSTKDADRSDTGSSSSSTTTSTSSDSKASTSSGSSGSGDGGSKAAASSSGAGSSSSSTSSS